MCYELGTVQCTVCNGYRQVQTVTDQASSTHELFSVCCLRFVVFISVAIFALIVS